MRRNLIFTSAGRSHNVRQWLTEGREYDIWVYDYANGQTGLDGVVEYYTILKGGKFPNLLHAYSTNPEKLRNYSQVLVMDDDIQIDPLDISIWFRRHRELDLWVSQAAFLPQGKVSHPITVARPFIDLRFTSFVEMTCPLFRRDMLDLFMAVYDKKLVGYGADYWFLHTLPLDRVGKIVVFDSIRCLNPWDNTKEGGIREITRLQSQAERVQIFQQIMAEMGVEMDQLPIETHATIWKKLGIRAVIEDLGLVVHFINRCIKEVYWTGKRRFATPSPNLEKEN